MEVNLTINSNRIALIPSIWKNSIQQTHFRLLIPTDSHFCVLMLYYTSIANVFYMENKPRFSIELIGESAVRSELNPELIGVIPTFLYMKSSRGLLKKSNSNPRFSLILNSWSTLETNIIKL